jgi:transcriptional regulator with PAS, ATPase and Fis domain
VIHVEIPSLRDRRDDIPLLVEHFVDKYNLLQGKEVAGVTPEVLAALMEYDYPGNIRELENTIEHAFVLCQNGLIQLHHLPAYIRNGTTHRLSNGMGGMNLKSMEKTLIAEALHRHQGNRSLAAKDLGINPSTLYRKIKELKVDVPRTDGRSNNSNRHRRTSSK